jgi:hypothetical protein
VIFITQGALGGLRSRRTRSVLQAPGHATIQCARGPLFIRKSCDHHGAAVQPSRRHRDTAVELRKGGGRGGFGSPLRPPSGPGRIQLPKSHALGPLFGNCYIYCDGRAFRQAHICGHFQAIPPINCVISRQKCNSSWLDQLRARSGVGRQRDDRSAPVATGRGFQSLLLAPCLT